VFAPIIKTDVGRKDHWDSKKKAFASR